MNQYVFSLALLVLAGALSGCGKAPNAQAAVQAYPPSVTEYRDGLVKKEWATAGLSRYRDTEAGVVCYESSVGLSCVPENETKFAPKK